MSLLQETHNQYATFDDNVKCGSIDVADLVVTSSASIAGLAVVTTAQNTAVGLGAGGVNNVQNVTVGSAAGASLVSGSNVVVGYGAVTTGACSGANGVVIGANAAPVLAAGANNVVVGAAAATVLASGSSNVIIGNAAGSLSAVAGINNVIIGNVADLGGDFSGCVALGGSGVGPFNADNQLGVSAFSLANTANAGGAGAPPVGVAGYLPIFIGAVQYMIPLYIP